MNMRKTPPGTPNGKEILVVEDSDVQAILLQRAINQRGYKVTRARNGEEGLDIARKLKPAIIVSDIMMPVMDGFQMCKELKNDEETRDIPVIILSQLNDTEDIIRGLEAGADNYVTKPFDPDYLVTKAKFLIDNPELSRNLINETCVKFEYAGRGHTACLSKLKMINLLLSIYENAVRQNKELVKVQAGLATLNEQLEDKVKMRTASLIAEVEERKKVEEKLRESEETLRKAQEMARLGSWVLSVPDEAMAWSPEMYVIFGLNPRGFNTTYESLMSLIHPEDVDDLRKAVDNALMKDEPFDTEFRIITPDGEERIVSSNGRVYRDESGRPLKMIGVTLDITDRKHSEMALLRLNRTLRLISRCNQTLIHSTIESKLLEEICRLIIDFGGYRFTWVGFAENDERKSVTPAVRAGYESGYVEVGEVTWSDEESGRCPIGRAIRTGRTFVSNNIFSDTSGEWWVEQARQRGYASVIAIPLAVNGNTMGALGVYSDEPDSFTSEEVAILEEMASDLAYGINTLRGRQAHELAEKNLESSEERYRSIVQTAMDGLWVADIEGRIMDVNEAYCAMSGYSKDELLKMRISDLEVLETEEETIKHIQKISETSFDRFETRHRRKSGAILDIEVSVKFSPENGGSVFAFLRDITARKEAEKALKQTTELLVRSEKLAALGQLSAGVAHEIKNPLNIISSYTQLLQMRNDSSPEALDYYKIIMEQVGRAAKIVENLRDFARERKPEIKNIDLHGFIDKTLALVEYEMRVENIMVVRNYNPTPITLPGDEDQLAQVFLNIIGNARDSMNEKSSRNTFDELQAMGWQARLIIDTTIIGEFIKIRFEDTGLGIPQEKQSRVFDPFFSTKGERKGTGLGLSIALGIIENHGGTIKADGEYGKGAVIEVTLPIASINCGGKKVALVEE